MIAFHSVVDVCRLLLMSLIFHHAISRLKAEQQLPALSSARVGIATYHMYSADQDDTTRACQSPISTNRDGKLMVTAMSEDYGLNNGLSCGDCLLVTNLANNLSTVVQVVDLKGASGLDMAPDAFNAISAGSNALQAGHMDISSVKVPCISILGSKKIRYRYKAGSTCDPYLGIMVLDHMVPMQGVQVSASKTGGFTKCKMTSSAKNWWMCTDHPPFVARSDAPLFYIKLIATTGEELIDEIWKIVPFDESQTVPSQLNVQFSVANLPSSVSDDSGSSSTPSKGGDKAGGRHPTTSGSDSSSSSTRPSRANGRPSSSSPSTSSSTNGLSSAPGRSPDGGDGGAAAKNGKMVRCHAIVPLNSLDSEEEDERCNELCVDEDKCPSNCECVALTTSTTAAHPSQSNGKDEQETPKVDIQDVNIVSGGSSTSVSSSSSSGPLTSGFGGDEGDGRASSVGKGVVTGISVAVAVAAITAAVIVYLRRRPRTTVAESLMRSTDQYVALLSPLERAASLRDYDD